MSPPSFSDIGKKFKDLYSKQFPAGFLKCLAKFPMTNGLAISLDGSHKLSSSQFTSNIETKAPIKISNLDITWVEKWTVKNELSTNFEINVVKDLTNGIEILYEPSTGEGSLKTKNSYKSDHLTAAGDMKFKTIRPEISLSFMTKMVQSIPLHGGASITYDSNKQGITNMSYGLQLDNESICMSATVTNNVEFLSQIYLKLSDLWDIGLETGWNQESKKSRFCGVTQIKVGTDSFVKTKIASCGALSMGYSFLAKEGIRLTLGMSLNTRNITSGDHEVGIQVEV